MSFFSYVLAESFSIIRKEAPDLTETPEKIDEIFSNREVVGGAYVVAYEGEILYEQYYGDENRIDKVPVTKDTHMRVASVSKMVTAMGAMQLVEQGVLHLDEPISTYLGFDYYNPHFPDIPITLRQILTHTTSISASTGAGLAQATTSLEKVVAHNIRYKKHFLKNAPGSTYQYSNYAYGLLGAIIEAVSGENINAYMQNHLFRPLEIDAAYHPLYLENQDHIATTYHRGKSYFTGEKYLKGYNSFENTVDPNHHYLITYGKLWIRGRDLAKLLMVLSSDSFFQGHSPLEKETVIAMRESQQGLGSVTGESPYSLGLHRIDNLIPHKMIYGHQGKSMGLITNAYFDPSTSLCVVIMTNGSDQGKEEGISHLARELFPLAYEIAGISLVP